MKKNTFAMPSSFKSPIVSLSTEKLGKTPLLRRQHKAKQSTIDSTNSLIHFTISDILNMVNFLKGSFQEDYKIILVKPSFSSDQSSNKTSQLIKFKIHSILSVFPYFSNINKNMKSFFSQRKNVLDRHQLMLNSLENIILYINNSIPKSYIPQNMDFSCEKECLQYFLQIFPPEFFNYLDPNTYCPKIFSSLWRHFKYSSTQDLLYESLKLFLYGISIPSFAAEEYLLHKAVFEGNLPAIRRLCLNETIQLFYCDIEAQDPLGLTPLMYAIKMNRKDAVLVLTECGCNPKLRSNPLLKTPIEEAVTQRAHIMLKYLLLTGHRLRQSQWELEKERLINAIEKIPDFSCEMNWECDSKFIPFAKRLAPSDTYKIYKKGSSLRVDMTLAGFSKLKCVRGNISALFKGRGYENQGKIFIIDHEKKKMVDLLSDYDMEQLDNNVDELIRAEHMNSEFKAENIDFNPSTNWKGDIQREKISGIETMKFIAKGGLNIQLNKKDYLEDFDFKKFKDFEDYFAYIIENSLLKEFHLTKDNSIIQNICEFMESDFEYLVSLLHNQEDSAEIRKILEMTCSMNKPKLKEGKSHLLENLHEYQKKYLKEFKKNINATIWLTNNFQLKIQHLLPILEILSSISNNIAQFKDFLINNFIKEANYFPIKAIIPLFYTLNAVVTFQNFKFSTPREELFSIDKEYLGKNNEVMDTSYRMKTEGNQHSSDNLPKVSFLQDWKAFFQNISNENINSMNNLKLPSKKLEEFFKYKEDKDDKDSEKSIEVAKVLFNNLKNDLVNVFDDKNNSSSQNNSNNIINSIDLTASKLKTARCEIPSEKKMTQIKVFTTHIHNIENVIKRSDSKAPYISRKDIKKSHLTIHIEKSEEVIRNYITANKVRESKEFHNITQLNESTKNKNKKKFLFKENENEANIFSNENKFFSKTSKNQHNNQKQEINLFFKTFNTKPLINNSNNNKNNSKNMIKHERIKSLDYNSKNRLLMSEDEDLLKKLHYQKIDHMDNEDGMISIKETLDDKGKDALKGRKKLLDADITYFKK